MEPCRPACTLAIVLLLAGLWPVAARERVHLDGAWEHAKVSSLTYPPAVTHWQPITVPGYLHGYNHERAWFRRRFVLPASMAGHRIKLRFGGVKYNSSVWLNGTHVGGHFNGYGLDADLSGGLNIRLQEKQAPSGNGTLSMDNAMYSALGQTLEISRGNIIFSGPLDDPLLDVRIERSENRRP